MVRIGIFLCALLVTQAAWALPMPKQQRFFPMDRAAPSMQLRPLLSPPAQANHDEAPTLRPPKADESMTPQQAALLLSLFGPGENL